MLAIFNMLGGPEFLIILIVGLILFGGRLPDVGKSVGKSLIEFRKGLRDLKKDIGLDEVSDLRKDLGQLTQAHYNLLDVNDDELDDRKESLGDNLSEEVNDRNPEEGSLLEDPQTHEDNSDETDKIEEKKSQNEEDDGPFAREDEEPYDKSLDELGIPLPSSEDAPGESSESPQKEKDLSDSSEPPKFGYQS
jgi:sec-independent protein translocase protein TatA